MAPCPYCRDSLALAPLAVIALLILILFCAFKVSAKLLDHVTISLTLMLPAVPVELLVLKISTLVVDRLLDSVAPVILPPLAAIV